MHSAIGVEVEVALTIFKPVVDVRWALLTSSMLDGISNCVASLCALWSSFFLASSG